MLEIDQQRDKARQTFVERVGVIGSFPEFLQAVETQLGKGARPLQHVGLYVWIGGGPVYGEKAVRVAGNSVTESQTFAETASLVHHRLAEFRGLLQVLFATKDLRRFDQEQDVTRGTVTPLDQSIASTTHTAGQVSRVFKAVLILKLLHGSEDEVQVVVLVLFVFRGPPPLQLGDKVQQRVQYAHDAVRGTQVLFPVPLPHQRQSFFLPPFSFLEDLSHQLRRQSLRKVWQTRVRSDKENGVQTSGATVQDFTFGRIQSLGGLLQMCLQ